MVNLWPGIPAKYLCDKHLNAVLAEYNNKLMPSMRKGHSIEKYLLHGCIDIKYITTRVVDCLVEAEIRGHKWKYPLPSDQDLITHYNYAKTYPKLSLERQKEMGKMNKMILAFRCPDCRKRMEGET